MPRYKSPALRAGCAPAKTCCPTLIANPDGSFTFNPDDGSPAVIIPKSCCPTLTANPDGSFTFNRGDGSPPVTIPAIPIDIHITNGAYNPVTKELQLTLSNGNIINVPVSALLPVITDGTTVIGDGAATPLKAGTFAANLDGSYTWTAANGTTFNVPPSCCPTLTNNGDGTFTFTPSNGTPPTTINAQPPTIALTNGNLTITANGGSATTNLRGNLVKDLAALDLGYLLPV